MAEFIKYGGSPGWESGWPPRFPAVVTHEAGEVTAGHFCHEGWELWAYLIPEVMRVVEVPRLGAQLKWPKRRQSALAAHRASRCEALPRQVCVGAQLW